jgi:hypothetical protein
MTACVGREGEGTDMKSPFLLLSLLSILQLVSRERGKRRQRETCTIIVASSTMLVDRGAVETARKVQLCFPQLAVNIRAMRRIAD